MCALRCAAYRLHGLRGPLLTSLGFAAKNIIRRYVSLACLILCIVAGISRARGARSRRCEHRVSIRQIPTIEAAIAVFL